MKTAVVTGASSGIGKEICRMLNGHGIRVYGIGRTFCEDQAAQTPLFIPIICDLSDTAALTGLIRRILSETPVDILINNAGTAYYGPHEELNPQKIHEMVAVNLEAPLILTQLLLRSLKACLLYTSDIFYSLNDCWQRDFGYCRLYDEACAPLAMIIDCEPCLLYTSRCV